MLDDDSGPRSWSQNRSHEISAVMFMVAAVVFLLTALFGDAGANTAFVVLAMVFVVLALNAWRAGQSESGQ